MSGLDKNRKRNQTVSFRMTPDEKRELEARIKVTGMPKGTYFIESLLYQEIHIAVGKYQSDRLSLEIRHLRKALEIAEAESQEVGSILMECKALIEQLLFVIGEGGMNLQHNDFKMASSESENAPAGNKDIFE